jgi:hypothetical protein
MPSRFAGRQQLRDPALSSLEENQSAKTAMYRRVEESLSYRLTMHRIRAPELSGLLERDLSDLPLFVELGALTEDEAKNWRERFTLAAEAFGASDSDVVDRGRRTRARELLKEALDGYRESPPDSDRRSFWRFPAVLRTLKAVGAVSESEAEVWDREFHDVLTQKSKPKREAHERAQRQAQRGQRPKPYRAADLYRVVIGPQARLNGVRVTCAELYEDCVIVRWHRILSVEEFNDGELGAAHQPTSEELASCFGAVLALEDDLGTGYTPAADAHEISGDKVWENEGLVPVWGRSVFVPGPPEGVRRLTAVNGEDEFGFQLTAG